MYETNRVIFVRGNHLLCQQVLAILLLLAVVLLWMFLPQQTQSNIEKVVTIVDSSEEIHDQVYEELQLQKQQQQQQQQQVFALQQQLQAALAAQSVRLGRLQARLYRLDSLGTNLVDMSGITGLEFDTLEEPGLGGAETELIQRELLMADIEKMLGELEQKTAEQEENLIALELWVMGKDLHKQQLPEGRPVSDGWISSPYGIRNDPFTGRRELHRGIDFVSRSGAPIFAVAEGIVTTNERSGAYGLMVEINHGNGYITRYAHNRKNLVTVGEKVSRGQKIALMGSTGRSTGTHVHFEVLHNGKQINPFKFVEISSQEGSQANKSR